LPESTTRQASPAKIVTLILVLLPIAHMPDVAPVTLAIQMPATPRIVVVALTLVARILARMRDAVPVISAIRIRAILSIASALIFLAQQIHVLEQAVVIGPVALTDARDLLISSV
jgi:hypothetical protein